MVKHYRCCEARVCVGTEEEVISSTWDRKNGENQIQDLVVQWLRTCLPKQGTRDFIPGLGS